MEIMNKENKELLVEKLNQLKEFGYTFRYNPNVENSAWLFAQNKCITIGPEITLTSLITFCNDIIQKETYLKSGESQKIIDILTEVGMIDKKI
jgi:hypothetical protein